MSAHLDRRYLLVAPSLAILALLDGCATLGGNVKGSFSCTAPAGVCAPSSTIDDRALAMISGEAGDMAIPAGPYVPPTAQPRKNALAVARPATGTGRSSERVLRVVFQPYVDDYGRLHEASAVRTVVRGEWQTADASPPLARGLQAARTGASLADAVDRDDPPVEVAAVDPDLPDPTLVAVARARRPDPVAAIKADVAARLAVRPHRRAVARRAPAARLRGPGARGVASPVPDAVAVAPAVASALPGPALSAETAGARVRTDPRWTSAATSAPGAARTAAGTASSAPVMRATTFPGVTSEEN